MTGPLGPDRLDQLVALLASVIANVNRAKAGKAFKPADFMPKWDQRAPAGAGEQTGEDHLRMIRGLNRAMGGKQGGDRDGDSR